MARMKPGFRIYTKVNRPPGALLEKFKDIPVANIADNMGRISCVDTGIKPFNRIKMVGSAITVKAPLGDNLMFHKALDIAQPGDIIVVDGEGSMNHSLTGEVMMRYAMSRGIKGFVVDGCIRDVEAVQEMEFGVFARGVQPKGPYKNGPGEINVPVSIGGQVVNPGDILCCDMDGIVVIKPDDALYLLEKSLQQNQVEQEVMEQIEMGLWDRSWVDKELENKGCEIIEDFAYKS
ncbi:MAG: Dimethylmenaquinone methyltransferase [Neobacillus sp.]|nr:Dimethylmenaquinone methyltransferase [Neobacillus sp.]